MQVEIDFKAECKAGEVVLPLSGRCATNDALSSNGAGPAALSFLHVLQRGVGDEVKELVRARSTWRVGKL